MLWLLREGMEGSLAGQHPWRCLGVWQIRQQRDWAPERREVGITYKHTPISLSVGNPLPSAWPHLPKALRPPQTASSAGGKISHP